MKKHSSKNKNDSTKQKVEEAVSEQVGPVEDQETDTTEETASEATTEETAEVLLPEKKEEIPEDAAEEASEEVSEEISDVITEEVSGEEPEKVEESSDEEESDEDEESEEESGEEEEEEDSDEEEDEEKDSKKNKKRKKKSASETEDEERELTPEEQAAKEEQQAKEKSSIYMFFDTLRFVAIGLLIGILLVVFVVQRNDVYGSSMEPTLKSGDAVFVQMITVYTGNFKRGDIVTIDAKGMEGYTHEENLIKRIVGLPGETIRIDEGQVYINGVLLDESAYLPEDTRTFVRAEGMAKGYNEITLGQDEYYCMGDNRGASNDSRLMGPFKKSQLESKVIMRIYPFNKIKFF